MQRLFLLQVHPKFFFYFSLIFGKRPVSSILMLNQFFFPLCPVIINLPINLSTIDFLDFQNCFFIFRPAEYGTCINVKLIYGFKPISKTSILVSHNPNNLKLLSILTSNYFFYFSFSKLAKNLLVYFYYFPLNSSKISFWTALLSADSLNNNFIVFVDKSNSFIAWSKSSYLLSIFCKLNSYALSHTRIRLLGFYLSFRKNNTFSLRCTFQRIYFFFKIQNSLYEKFVIPSKFRASLFKLLSSKHSFTFLTHLYSLFMSEIS